MTACRLRAGALLLAFGLGSGAFAAPQLYRLDPEHSFVHFEVQHFGTSLLRGRFGPLHGDVTLDADAARGHVSLRINMRTLDTGLKLLDGRLARDDLLAIEAHPEAFFVAERFVFDAQGHPVSLTGEFTLRGIGSALTLRAQRFACVHSPGTTARRCGGDFEGELQRSTFGASFGVPLIADKVRLRVQVEGVEDLTTR